MRPWKSDGYSGRHINYTFDLRGDAGAVVHTAREKEMITAKLMIAILQAQIEKGGKDVTVLVGNKHVNIISVNALEVSVDYDSNRISQSLEIKQPRAH